MWHNATGKLFLNDTKMNTTSLRFAAFLTFVGLSGCSSVDLRSSEDKLKHEQIGTSRAASEASKVTAIPKEDRFSFDKIIGEDSRGYLLAKFTRDGDFTGRFEDVRKTSTGKNQTLNLDMKFVRETKQLYERDGFKMMCISFETYYLGVKNSDYCFHENDKRFQGKTSSVIRRVEQDYVKRYKDDLETLRKNRAELPYAINYRIDFRQKYPYDTANIDSIEKVFSECEAVCDKSQAKALINDSGVPFMLQYNGFRDIYNKFVIKKADLEHPARVLSGNKDDAIFIKAFSLFQKSAPGDTNRESIERMADMRIRERGVTAQYRDAYFRMLRDDKLKNYYDNASREDKKMIEDIAVSQYIAKEVGGDKFRKSLYYSSLDDAALNQTYKSAKEEDKQALEDVIVPRFAAKLAIIKFSAKGGNDRAYGASGSDWGNQIMSSLMGSKTGIERKTPVNYSIQLDPSLFKVKGSYKYSATLTLTAHGEGEYESHCAWPLPMKCNNKKSQDTYSESITGVISGNQLTTGVKEITWNPKYVKQGMTGLTSAFRTDRVSVNISDIRLSPN